jgi:hypothetical protein
MIKLHIPTAFSIPTLCGTHTSNTQAIYSTPFGPLGSNTPTTAHLWWAQYQLFANTIFALVAVEAVAVAVVAVEAMEAVEVAHQCQ